MSCGTPDAFCTERLQEREIMILYILDLGQFEKSEYCTEQSKHKKHHEAGQFLLRRALGDEIYEQVEFAKNEHGKPYIVGLPIHYNISHSGYFVVLVTSDAEVGVDIQEKRRARMESVAKRFFSEEEWQAISLCESEEEKQNLFYRIWCRKEAYGKYLGVGLSNHLLSVNVLEEPIALSAENVEENPEDNVYRKQKLIKFRDLEITPDYQISICSRKGEHLEKIVSVFEGL